MFRLRSTLLTLNFLMGFSLSFSTQLLAMPLHRSCSSQPTSLQEYVDPTEDFLVRLRIVGEPSENYLPLQNVNSIHQASLREAEIMEVFFSGTVTGTKLEIGDSIFVYTRSANLPWTVNNTRGVGILDFGSANLVRNEDYIALIRRVPQPFEVLYDDVEGDAVLPELQNRAYYSRHHFFGFFKVSNGILQAPQYPLDLLKGEHCNSDWTFPLDDTKLVGRPISDAARAITETRSTLFTRREEIINQYKRTHSKDSTGQATSAPQSYDDAPSLPTARDGTSEY